MLQKLSQFEDLVGKGDEFSQGLKEKLGAFDYEIVSRNAHILNGPRFSGSKCHKIILSIILLTFPTGKFK
jgi:hypothetical protein